LPDNTDTDGLIPDSTGSARPIPSLPVIVATANEESDLEDAWMTVLASVVHCKEVTGAAGAVIRVHQVIASAPNVASFSQTTLPVRFLINLGNIELKSELPLWKASLWDVFAGTRAFLYLRRGSRFWIGLWLNLLL
jgi:hypothetical protein